MHRIKGAPEALGTFLRTMNETANILGIVHAVICLNYHATFLILTFASNVNQLRALTITLR